MTMRDARAIATPPASGCGDRAPRRRSRGARVAILGAGSLAVVLLVALGSWQVHRLRWKLDLIATVDARVHAPPVAPPAPPAWPAVTADADQYLHVAARGAYDNARETFVQAVTDDGPGFWLVTPFRTDAGFTVLVNRGFVPPERRDPSSRAPGEISGPTGVTGLLRVDEPGGAFLRHNDPGADRWFSRDVRAIAAKRSDCIGGTARAVSAAGRQHDRRPQLPAAREPDQRLRDHRAIFASALPSSISSNA